MQTEWNRPRRSLLIPRREVMPRASRRCFLQVVALGATAALGRVASAAEPRFAATISALIGGKTVRLVLTGAAQRTKYWVRVYNVASYVAEGVSVRTPEALATLDAPKQLVLVFDRDVDGATMAESFRGSIGQGHPAPAFARELTLLERFFVANPVKVGDQITLTHIPATGLGVQLNTRPVVVIPSVAFAQAAWGTYFGPHHLGVALKESLSARLR